MDNNHKTRQIIGKQNSGVKLDKDEQVYCGWRQNRFQTWSLQAFSWEPGAGFS